MNFAKFLRTHFLAEHHRWPIWMFVQGKHKGMVAKFTEAAVRRFVQNLST